MTHDKSHQRMMLQRNLALNSHNSYCTETLATHAGKTVTFDINAWKIYTHLLHGSLPWKTWSTSTSEKKTMHFNSPEQMIAMLLVSSNKPSGNQTGTKQWDNSNCLAMCIC